MVVRLTMLSREEESDPENQPLKKGMLPSNHGLQGWYVVAQHLRIQNCLMNVNCRIVKGLDFFEIRHGLLATLQKRDFGIEPVDFQCTQDPNENPSLGIFGQIVYALNIMNWV
jgi:hypothetical protein